VNKWALCALILGIVLLSVFCLSIPQGWSRIETEKVPVYDHAGNEIGYFLKERRVYLPWAGVGVGTLIGGWAGIWSGLIWLKKDDC